MITLETVADLRAACDGARAAGLTVGLVPTMGYFHEGHRSLMRAARAECGFVVVTVFVNPTQFAPGEDLDAYPRDPDGDADVARLEGVDVLFAPPLGEVYSGHAATTVHVAGVTEGLCGASRPGHFDGVATIVTKLFSMTGPCRAFFGRKDAQQLVVVQRLVRDLDLPVVVVPCPLVRDHDGLAMSSRNAYLSRDDRRAATVLARALHRASEQLVRGERDARVIRQGIVDRIAEVHGVHLEYAEVVDAASLRPVERIDGDTLVALAARVGKARLIDNVTITFDDGTPRADLGIVVAGSRSELCTPAFGAGAGSQER